jgi:hypothetical protein
VTKKEIREMQVTLNRFTGKYLKGVHPLRVDGVRGHATNIRILAVKYYLGYSKYEKSKKHPGGRDSSWLPLTVRRVRHPRSRKYSSAKMIATGIARRHRQKLRWAQQHVHATVTSGVTTYDGTPVAKWLVPYLQYARSHGWQGRLNSGWRSPSYSTSLCYRMCGAPSCPGRCAGAASNHAGSDKPRGALDVSDYYRFGAIMRNAPFNPRIYNALGSRDPVHYSASGN